MKDAPGTELPEQPSELAQLWRLAYPIVLAQVGLVSMGVVDTLLIGPLGSEALASLALGNALYFGLLIFGMGLMMSLDAFVSQAFGAGDLARCRHGLVQALWIALAVTPLLFGILTFLPDLLAVLGYGERLIELARDYVNPLRWGVLPALAFVAYRSFMSAVDVTRPLLLSALLANVANLVLDLWFIHGGAGVPPLGVVGVAWSTTACRLALLAPLALIVALRSDFRRFPKVSWRPHPPTLRALLALGIPIGLQLGSEVGTFAAAALMMGMLGAEALAAHQVAINVTSLLFMVPLGLGAAAAVRTGQALGEGRIDKVRLAGWTALRLTLGYAAVTAVLLGFFGDLIASLYRLDAGIEGLAVQLLLVAAFFQLGDTVQATAAGALRGLGDTQVPFLLTLGSHVLLALPLAAAAGLIVFRDPLWIWYSLAAGLTVLAALLVIRFQFKVRSLEGKP